MDDKVYSARPHCVECAYAGGVAILDTQSNAYYSMNEVGRFVWQRIQSPAKQSEVVRGVADEYDVDAASCRADIEALLNDLAANDLVLVS